MASAEETLQSVPLFKGLNQKHLKSLARWTTTRNYGAGQVVVKEGQTGMGLYCIQSGKVQVSIGGRDVRTMGPGETFGEISLIDDQPRSATITAVDPTTAVLLDKSQFLAELHTHPEIAVQILPVLAGRLREAEGRSGAD